MGTEETKEQQQVYNIFRSCIYVFLIIELVMNLPYHGTNRVVAFILDLFYRFQIFNSVLSCKVIELVCVAVTCIGTKAKKSLKFNIRTMVLYPIIAGFSMIIFCMVVHIGEWGGMMSGIPFNRVLYAITSILGTMLVHHGGDGIARYYNYKLGDDRFNFENESFEQSREKNENEYSVNIPMIFYHNKKMHKGWINIINPFRGTIVLGTPGSGKSFGIIDPFIRQHSAKGFTMMVYDYKFPTLAKNLFYQYCKNKRYGHLPENCAFNIVNFTDVEYSNRINPIQRKYIPDLAAASETAATLLSSLNKGGDKKGGSEAFFQNSAENFLASIIYFFVNFHPTGFKNGRKLQQYILFEGQKLRLNIRNWTDYEAVDEKGKVVLDFVNNQGDNVSVDSDKMFVDLDGFSYTDIKGKNITITRSWYEDENGKEVEPDTITGEFSDMPHVLSFLGRAYAEVFDILMQDEKIMSLMARHPSSLRGRTRRWISWKVWWARCVSMRRVWYHLRLIGSLQVMTST